MKPQDELWWACLDGEMTSTESAQYDKELSDDDHRLMSEEIELERRLGEVLSRPAPNSDAAWRAALAQVKERSRVRRGVAHWRHRLALAAVPAAVAAVALVVFGAGHVRPEAPKPWFLSVDAHDASERGASSRVKEVVATARNVLRDNEMRMAFDPGNSLQAAGASWRLVAVRREEHAGEPVVEMVFLCDGNPAKVIITGRNGNVAHEIAQAAVRGVPLASRSVGDWLVTVVGAAAPERLLSLLEEARAEPQGQTTPVSETPQMKMFVPDTAVMVPETAVASPETIASPPEMAAVPPEITVASPETAPASPETAVVVPGTTADTSNAAVIPPDSPVIQPNTAVAPPQSSPVGTQSVPAAGIGTTEADAVQETPTDPHRGNIPPPA